MNEENLNLGLNPQNPEIKIRKKRKKSDYKKISNQTRKHLLELVYLREYNLKEASSMLNINYSTAKTILRIFRLEKRIEKKNADEEKNLKEIFLNVQRERKDDNTSYFTDKESQGNILIAKNEISIEIHGNNLILDYSYYKNIVDNNIFIHMLIKSFVCILQQLKGSLELINENESEIHGILSILKNNKIFSQTNQYFKY